MAVQPTEGWHREGGRLYSAFEQSAFKARRELVNHNEPLIRSRADSFNRHGDGSDDLLGKFVSLC